MNQARLVKRIIEGRPTLEGAGVHLTRVFGFSDTGDFDPFLLMDHFGSDNPDDYIAGFPWHPHRGIETVTYVLKGQVAHGDSLGSKGVIGAGDVQWMTAGSGIIHQEMPKGDEAGAMAGFQLWANLPASRKMTEPMYREFKADAIPTVTLDTGTKIRVIAGRVNDMDGPMTDLAVQPEYLDITLAPNGQYAHPVPKGHTAFCYVFEGSVSADGYPTAAPDRSRRIDKGHLALFSDGDYIRFDGGSEAARFLLISGKPLGEPIAWAGPIVMNTKEELDLAFEEYRSGKFIKKGEP